MSRLRRIEQHSRFFFVTCNLRKSIPPFNQVEFEMLADALDSVRCKVDVALCGYCLMPDHWHAILLPGESAAISDVLLRIKTAAGNRIRRLRHDPAPIWQPRSYDHVLRTRHEFDETLNYMHQNPVRQGLIQDPRDWNWSSARWFLELRGPLQIDEVKLPLNPWDRI